MKQSINTVLLGLLCIPLQTYAAEENNWLGKSDSNWAIANNWSSNSVPGTETSESAILTGSNIRAVVATPFQASLLQQLIVNDGAYLLIEEAIKIQDDILLGAVENSAGGELYQHADVTVADSLRIGHLTTLTTASQYTVGEGVLAVTNEIVIQHGDFQVKGIESEISADSLQVLSDGSLTFDLGVQGVTPVNLASDFIIEPDAKLTVDIRGYTAGGNVVELVNYSSLTGSFDPSNVTIIGLGGGTLNYGNKSLTVTVTDTTQAPVSNLWIKAKPADIEVNTGHLIRNLSSADLTYTEQKDGNDLLYTIDWKGSDFDGDSSNDTISFDLRIKGNTGSTFNYSETEGESSVSLGGANTASAGNDLWGAGTDNDLDAGESINFSVENVTFSVKGYTAEIEGFLSFRLDEVSGYTHQLIIGEGAALNSVVNNSPKDFSLNAVSSLTITGAGSGTSATPGIGDVSFKLSISNTSNVAKVIDESDYSSFSVGPTFKGNYPAETNFDHYPEFSWDIVPRWATVNYDMTEEQAQIIAQNHDVISLGGFQDEEESIEEAALLKKYNPKIKTLFYINTYVNFSDFNADAAYDTENWNTYLLDANGEREYDMIRNYYSYNHKYPEMRDWWVDLSVRMSEEPEIDGVFIDKGHGNDEFINDDGQLEAPETGAGRSYFELSQNMPNDSLLIANSLRNEKPGGNRRMMEVITGSYVERWDLPFSDSPVAQSDADAIAVSIQLMREAAVKGKILMPALHDRLSDEFLFGYIDAGKEDELIAYIQEKVVLQLAYFLIVAEKYSYFRYQPDQNVERFPEYVWDPTAYVDELTKPLGEPLGPPVKNGYIYTRSFKYVDVWLNIETNEATLTWYDKDVCRVAN